MVSKVLPSWNSNANGRKNAAAAVRALDYKGLVELRSRESREEVIAIVEMSNNVGLKATSESEEMGTDE